MPAILNLQALLSYTNYNHIQVIATYGETSSFRRDYASMILSCNDVLMNFYY